MRFKKADGYMSTPCGVHEPIHFETFGRRVDEWAFRVRGAEFFHREYGESLNRARDGDVVYCDHPYGHSQAILYGAQGFDQDDLFRRIEKAKSKSSTFSPPGPNRDAKQKCESIWVPTESVRDRPGDPRSPGEWLRVNLES